MLLCDASQCLKRKKNSAKKLRMKTKAFVVVFPRKRKDENVEVDSDHILFFTQN